MQLVRSSLGIAPALSPDGTRYAVQETRLEEGRVVVGGITIHDARTQQELVRLDDLCDSSADDAELVNVEGDENCQAFPTRPFALRAWQIHWSPDGQMIAAVNAPVARRRGFFAVWNARNGRIIEGSLGANRLDADVQPTDVSFTPDESRIIVAYTAGDQKAGWLDAISTTTWQIEATHERSERDLEIVFVGYSSDASGLLAVSGYWGKGGGALHWFDPDTLVESRPARAAIHDGTPIAVAISPGSSLVATAAADGSLRIWDAATGALVHWFSFRGQDLTGVAFLEETHLGVLIDGDFQVLTIDTDELLAIVRGSLTDGFTQAECDRYKISPCPSLDEMRSP
jgi:WD40 repeat protein